MVGAGIPSAPPTQHPLGCVYRTIIARPLAHARIGCGPPQERPCMQCLLVRVASGISNATYAYGRVRARSPRAVYVRLKHCLSNVSVQLYLHAACRANAASHLLCLVSIRHDDRKLRPPRIYHHSFVTSLPPFSSRPFFWTADQRFLWVGRDSVFRRVSLQALRPTSRYPRLRFKYYRHSQLVLLGQAFAFDA